MGNYRFDVPIIYGTQDNYSFTAKRIYKIRECKETLVQNNASDLWCNNLCSQDEKYCNPFVNGDKLYFQFFNNATSYWKVLPKIINFADNSVVPSAALITTQAGTDPAGNNYLNFILNIPQDFAVECFYIKIYLFACDVNQTIYQNCVNDAINAGSSAEEAELECSITLCGSGVSELMTEPYCKVKCEDTILIEGYYPKYDCNGNYYGDIYAGSPPTLTANIFKPQIRIPGEISKENYGFETVVVNNQKQKSTQKQAYRLYTPKIPPYVADKLAVIFNSQKLIIGGEEYKPSEELNKNNEDGQMWIINTLITKNCEQISFNCS